LPASEATSPATASAADIARWERAALGAHDAGRGPHLIAFHRTGPTISIGCHQAVEHEVRRTHCDRAGIAVMRRNTGGGALYLDRGHQGMSVVVPAACLGATLADRLETGARIVADALAVFGIATAFKAPNDVETGDGRKIASVFLAEHQGSALLYANVIERLDLEAALQALLVPTEKLTRTGLEQARGRMADLTELLGRAPGAEALQAALLDAAQSRLGLALMRTAPPQGRAEAPVLPAWATGPDGFETLDRTWGATLRLRVEMADGKTLSGLRFATDGHIAPAATFDLLAVSLIGQPLAEAPAIAARRLDEIGPDLVGFAASDLVALLARASAKQALQAELGLSPDETSAVMLAGSQGDTMAPLDRASVMLVPYCAKPAWCKWRHRTGCAECGLCDVGEAYRMGRARNMEVLTIVDYEHLVATLAEMKAAGVESYVGMCCGEFFLKRHGAFRECGLPATLVDIKGATCYELKQEHLAYAGTFSAEAALDLDTLGKVMVRVPKQEAAAHPRLSSAPPRPGREKAGPGRR